MAKTPSLSGPEFRPIALGGFRLHETGVKVIGRPSFEEYVGALEFARRSHKCSGFWLADLMRYGDKRAEWAERLSQAQDATGLSEKTLKNIRAVGRIEPSRRRDDVPFALHETVSGLQPEEQTEWLAKAAEHGWDRRELRMEIRAARRRRIIEGQAVLSGVYRVIYADPPWLYNDRPPSGSGAQTHYPGMTIEQMCKLPVMAHTYSNAVLFLWVTAPFLLANPGPRELLDAWGFEYKANIVWDKVRSAGGHYVANKHEHLIIATRGSCTPDHPVPSPDSVQTVRQEGEHSAKPVEFRKIIEQLYDGPYLELFGREKVDGWDVFGNDAALWKQEG